MILVIGATGNVGSQTVAQLREKGAEFSALVRDPGTAALPGGTRTVRGDLTDPAGLRAALDAADGPGRLDAVFLMWPLHGTDVAEEVVGLLAERARRIVYLSTRGVPDDDASEPAEGIIGFHTVMERLVRAHATEWTLLRPGGFAANTLGWAPEFRAGGPVRMPYPGASRSLIHEADIAAVAVKALLTDGLVARKPELTGPASVTMEEQARTIGEVLGHPVEVEKVSPEQARDDFLAQGMPPAYATGIVEAHARMEAHPETVTSEVEEITGRPACTYRRWAEDHAADFR